MFEQIDNGHLNRVKNDATSKSKQAKDCDKTMVQFFYSKKNLFYLVRDSMTLHELSQWIQSLTHYIKKKKNVAPYRVDKREVVLIDFGFNVGDNISYSHPGVVIEKTSNGVFVVPCSTGKLKYAYNSDGTVKNEFLIGELTDGFTKKSTLILNNAKWVSQSSIVKNNGIKITKTFYDQITEKLLELSLNERYLEREHLKSTISKLEEKIEVIDEKLKNAKISIIEKDIEISRLLKN